MKVTSISLAILSVLLLLTTCKKDPKNDDNSTLPKSGFGQVNFTLDNSLTLGIDIGEQPQSISVTDKNQVKWTLDIPAQPYAESSYISMTPVGSFGTSVISCRPVSGMVFSPDGFYFAAPATLTVEFPVSQTGKLLFYSIKGTGVNDTLDLMPADLSGKKYTLTLYHFSGAMGGEPFDGDKAYKEAKARYNAAMAEAQALSKLPVTVSPPPAVPINPCTGTVSRSQESAIQNFVDGICEPEHSIQNKILAAQKAMCFMGNNNLDGPDCEANYNASGLNNRLVQKAFMLISQYGNIDDYLVPVRRAVFKIGYADEFSGGDAYGALIQGLADNVYKVRDNTLKKLRDEHDYKVIKQLIRFTRDYCMLSATCDEESFLELVRKAATFKASIITEFKKTDNTTIVITDFKPRFELNDTYDSFTSTSNIDFIEGSIKKGASHAKCGGEWAQLIPYNMPMEVDLTLDVCEANDASISFGPILRGLPIPNEMQTGSYWNPTPEPGHCETMSGQSAWAYAAFMSQVGITTLFDFMRNTILIKEQGVNKKAMLIDKTLPFVSGGFTITYTIKLEHTPK
jgi:hypothetical protein